MDGPYRQNSPDLWHGIPCEQEPSALWDGGRGAYAAVDLGSNEENLYYMQQSPTNYLDSPVSSYSHPLFEPLPGGGNPKYAIPYTSYIFDSAQTMNTQSPSLLSSQLGELFCGNDTFNSMTSASHINSSPFLHICPASSPKSLCPCTNNTLGEWLALPYKRHHGSKPLRAKLNPCRKSLVERFPFERRDSIITILSDPVSHIPMLMDLVVRYDKDTHGNRFGCICCPNARFQSAAKAERHLRGFLDIRTVPCQYCPWLSIHRDDNKDHEKKCTWKKTSANTLSHSK